MIKIKNIKIVSRELISYQLENGEEIVLNNREIAKMGEGRDAWTALSINDNEYNILFSETEYSDDIREIIGFEKY